ncbi:MAG: haloacid dehalogenase-like hydrolase, partial [Gammaproteobacteria bacterium]
LFRINKGREEQLETINEYMPEGERPIPFQHMLYVGDGLTDVPCMTVVKNYGGFSVAVHKPRNQASIDVCRELVDANRIDFYAPADYRPGKRLESRVQTILDLIIARINFEHERHDFLQEMSRSARPRS